MYRQLSKVLLDRAFERRYQSRLPVVSVGGISVGGSGKTPVLLRLIDLLAPMYRLIVLSRGYGRKSSEQMSVEVTETNARIWNNPELIGDEPVLLAMKLRACDNDRTDPPIIGIGGERVSNLKRIEAMTGNGNHPTIVLLDDGFQHRQLDRDLDIVIVDDAVAQRPRLLPFGRLREPIASIGRADICLCTSRVSLDVCRSLVDHTRLMMTQTMETQLTRWSAPEGVAGAQSDPMVSDSGAIDAILVSAIARPHRFRDSADRLGLNVLHHETFRDHHRYREQDIRKIEHIRGRFPGALLVTTDKDAVKLCRFNNMASMLYVIRVEAAIYGEESVVEMIHRVAHRQALHISG